MKLPGINYTQTTPQSLGREDVYGPGRVLGATIARNQTASKTMGAAFKVYDQYERQQAEEAAKDNSIELQRRALSIQTELGQKPYWSAAELNEMGITGYEEDTRSRIATYEILPKAYQSGMQDTIEELGSNIKRNDQRIAWEQEAAYNLENHLSRLTMESLRMSQQARQEKYLDMAEEQLSLGNPEGARDVLRAGEQYLDDNTLRDSHKKIDETEVTQKLDDILTYEEDPQVLRDQANDLAPENDKSNLPRQVSNDWADKFRRRADQLERGQAAAINAGVSGTKMRLADATDLMESGVDFNKPFAKSELELEATGVGLTVTDDKAMRDFERAKQFHKAFMDFRLYDVSKQSKLIAEMEAEANALGTDPERTYELDQYRKIHNQKVEDIKNRPMTLAMSEGYAHLTDISFDTERFVPSLVKRGIEFEKAKTIYANATFYTDRLEAEQFAAQFNSLSSQEQLAYMAQANEYLSPEHFDMVFGPTTKESVAPYQFAARVFADGHYGRAREILEGSKMEHPEKDVLSADIRAAMGNMYNGDPEYYESAHQAAMGLFISRFNSPTPITEEEAVNLVTGGKAEFGMSNITPPNLQVTPEQTENWATNLNPEVIKRYGGVKGMRPAQVSIELKLGNIQMVEEGKGLYALKIPNPEEPGTYSYLQRADGKDIFLLPYKDNQFISEEQMDRYYTLPQKSTYFRKRSDSYIYKSDEEIYGEYEEPETILAPKETLE